ncbi:phospholipid scramblase 4-like isoform X4 [Balaenoptera ricei]|uniref:phospholipid scramblase 4-like isoform X4 n=1 Tax=Balaenoptera ricei TaxID=2746895 RepID=UPI0028BEFF15|nr:phospholipid scramblase 4-like isoform X4 [Balaenoptera ricei]
MPLQNTIPVLYLGPQTSCPSTCMLPRRLASWWHPSYTVPAWQVKSLNGVSNVGSITWKWNGVLSAMSDADHFEVPFPLDLDVTKKAIFSGACFLMIIFQYRL